MKPPYDIWAIMRDENLFSLHSSLEDAEKKVILLMHSLSKDGFKFDSLTHYSWYGTAEGYGPCRIRIQKCEVV